MPRKTHGSSRHSRGSLVFNYVPRPPPPPPRPPSVRWPPDHAPRTPPAIPDIPPSRPRRDPLSPPPDDPSRFFSPAPPDDPSRSFSPLPPIIPDLTPARPARRFAEFPEPESPDPSPPRRYRDSSWDEHPPAPDPATLPRPPPAWDAPSRSRHSPPVPPPPPPAGESSRAYVFRPDSSRRGPGEPSRAPRVLTLEQSKFEKDMVYLKRAQDDANTAYESLKRGVTVPDFQRTSMFFQSNLALNVMDAVSIIFRQTRGDDHEFSRIIKSKLEQHLLKFSVKFPLDEPERAAAARDPGPPERPRAAGRGRARDEYRDPLPNLPLQRSDRGGRRDESDEIGRVKAKWNNGIVVGGLTMLKVGEYEAVIRYDNDKAHVWDNHNDIVMSHYGYGALLVAFSNSILEMFLRVADMPSSRFVEYVIDSVYEFLDDFQLTSDADFIQPYYFTPTTTPYRKPASRDLRVMSSESIAQKLDYHSLLRYTEMIHEGETLASQTYEDNHQRVPDSVRDNPCATYNAMVRNVCGLVLQLVFNASGVLDTEIGSIACRKLLLYIRDDGNDFEPDEPSRFDDPSAWDNTPASV